jgi:hypothetical protein
MPTMNIQVALTTQENAALDELFQTEDGAPTKSAYVEHVASATLRRAIKAKLETYAAQNERMVVRAWRQADTGAKTAVLNALGLTLNGLVVEPKVP